MQFGVILWMLSVDSRRLSKVNCLIHTHSFFFFENFLASSSCCCVLILALICSVQLDVAWGKTKTLHYLCFDSCTNLPFRQSPLCLCVTSPLWRSTLCFPHLPLHVKKSPECAVQDLLFLHSLIPSCVVNSAAFLHFIGFQCENLLVFPAHEIKHRGLDKDSLLHTAHSIPVLTYGVLYLTSTN